MMDDVTSSVNTPRQTDATAAGRAKYGHQTISSNDTIQVKIQSYQRFQIESTQKAGGQKKKCLFFSVAFC